jgi:outer membrane lipoprotein carrier protein
MKMGMGMGMGVAFALSLPSLATAQNRAVERAVAAWKNVKSVTGTFEQTVSNTLMRTSAVAKGSFAQQQPNKLALRFTDPAGDAIVSDGAFLWVFLQQATPGQVLKRPVSDDMASPIDIGQFLDDPAVKYDIVAKGADSVGGRATQQIGLTPKKGVDAPFTRATVWIDDADGLIRQFEVSEASGLVRRVRITKMNLNPALAASEFKFVVPKGVRIIER